MANLVYINPQSSITWTDSGGDETLDIGGLAADAVRQGDQHDLGAGPRPDMFEVRMVIDGFADSPVVGETVDLYFGYSDGTNHDADLGIADAAAATTDLPNLDYIGSAVVQTTTAADELIVTFKNVQITSRYVTPVVHNNTADVLLGSSDSHKIILTPVPPEVQ